MLGERRRYPFAVLRADARHRDQKLHRRKGRGFSLAHLLLEQSWRDPTASPSGDTRPLLGDGGLTASGNCVFDIRESDKIFADLAHWQKVVEDNEASIREALGVPLPQELSIKLMVTPGSCWLYEPVSQRRLALTFQP